MSDINIRTMNKELVTILSVFANIFLGAIKIIAGFMINSAALIADGIHSVTDFMSSLAVFFGVRFAKKPVDKEHPYGHYAAETISGLVVVFIMIISGIWIMYDGINSIIHKEMIEIGIVGFIVVGISIILNEAMARMKFKYGKKEQSLALIADAEHSRADVISSVGVLCALALSNFFQYADALFAILIGGYILRKSYYLGKEVIDNLLGARDEKAEQVIKEHCQKQNISITSLRSRKIGEITSAEIIIKLNADLLVDEAEQISKDLQQELMDKIRNLKYVVVQIESHKLTGESVRPRWGNRRYQNKKICGRIN